MVSEWFLNDITYITLACNFVQLIKMKTRETRVLSDVTNVRCACLKQCSLSEPVLVEHLRFLSKCLMIILKHLIVKPDINHSCHRRRHSTRIYDVCCLARIRGFSKYTVSSVIYDGFTTGRIKHITIHLDRTLCKIVIKVS